MERLVDRTIGAHQFMTDAAGPVPERARIVIVGGGVIGASIAYHLADAGEKDVLLLEARTLGSGTSWHAAGLVNTARGTPALTGLSAYSRDFYTRLGELSGLDVNWQQAGSLTFARVPGRVDELQYQRNVAAQCGIDAEMLGADGIRSLWPLAHTDGVLSALHIPADGHVNPGVAAVAFAKLAHERGVVLREGVAVTEVLVERGRAVGVRTERGDIAAEQVVLAAGLWTRDLAQTAGAAAPLYAASHVHVRSNPIDGVHPALPVLRDLDNSFYVRHEAGALLVGAFEQDGVPKAVPEIPADGFAEFEPDWEHFAAVRGAAERTIPALADAGFERFLNAPESFTPDANFLLGETGEVRALYVASGMNSQGIIFAPGVGRELAAWMQSGTAQFDATSVDIRRFSQHQSNRRYLHDRTREGLGRLYAMHWPNLQMTTGRGVRRSPLHHRVAAAGAQFGELNGWERANWYDPNAAPVTYSYTRPSWFDHVAAEHRACRENVVLFDLSPFAKFRVAGPDALACVQRAFTSDLDVPRHRATYTLQLNDAGGIELDLTVTRLDEHEFLVVTPSATQDKTLSILRRAAEGMAAVVFDATTSLACISVNGPRSRELLERVSPEDWSDAAHPYLSGRWVEIADGYAYALRVSFTGERGYELYVSSELAENVYDALWQAGQDLGVRPAGYYALDTLRIEKGFRHLGHDIGPTDDPRSAGLWFTVAMDKDAAFIGQAALRGIPERRHRTVYVSIDDPEPVFVHDETVFCDGVAVGRMTSGNYGHTLGRSVGLAVIDPACAVDHGVWEVECGARRYPLTVSTKPLYDPTGERLRG